MFDDKNGNGQVNNNELTSGPLPETVDISTLGGTDTVNVRLLSDLSADNRAALSNVTSSGPKLPIPLLYAEGVSVYVDLGTGNDKFEFSSPTAPLSSNIAIALSNAAWANVDSDPDGADITEGGDLVLQVDGGNDKDTINFDFNRTSVICSSLLATSDAGAGDDLVNLTLPDFQGAGEGSLRDPEEGIVACDVGEQPDPTATISTTGRAVEEQIIPSNVSVAIDLGSGKNTLNINARTVIDASDVHIEVDGGKDTDIINDNEEVYVTSRVFDLGGPAPTVSGKAEEEEPPIEVIPLNFLRSTYVVDIELGSGNDTYNQNLNFEDERPETKEAFIDFGGEVTFNVRGDSGKDSIKVKDVDNGLDPIDNQIPIFGKLAYNLYGGNDDDNVQFDTNPGAQFVMIGGSLKVLVSCDGGNDFGRIDLALVPNFTQLGTHSTADLTLSGGSGNDILGTSIQLIESINLAAPVKGLDVILIPPAGFFGARGKPLLDGGSGYDRYDDESNVFTVRRGAEKYDDSIEPEYIP